MWDQSSVGEQAFAAAMTLIGIRKRRAFYGGRLGWSGPLQWEAGLEELKEIWSG